MYFYLLNSIFSIVFSILFLSVYSYYYFFVLFGNSIFLGAIFLRKIQPRNTMPSQKRIETPGPPQMRGLTEDCLHGDMSPQSALYSSISAPQSPSAAIQFPLINLQSSTSHSIVHPQSSLKINAIDSAIPVYAVPKLILSIPNHQSSISTSSITSLQSPPHSPPQSLFTPDSIHFYSSEQSSTQLFPYITSPSPLYASITSPSTPQSISQSNPASPLPTETIYCPLMASQCQSSPPSPMQCPSIPSSPLNHCPSKSMNLTQSCVMSRSPSIQSSSSIHSPSNQSPSTHPAFPPSQSPTSSPTPELLTPGPQTQETHHSSPLSTASPTPVLPITSHRPLFPLTFPTTSSAFSPSTSLASYVFHSFLTLRVKRKRRRPHLPRDAGRGGEDCSPCLPLASIFSMDGE